MLSQKVTTNLINETVTLDKEKAIDVASIIKNEERLRLVVKEQLDIIRKQDSIILGLTQRNIIGLQSIQQQSNTISTLTSSIDELSKKQLELEESKRIVKGRLMLKMHYDFNLPTSFKSGNIGLLYTNDKYLFGATINPLNDTMIWGADVGIKIF